MRSLLIVLLMCGMGYSVEFDGTNDVVDATLASGITFADPITVVCWIKRVGTGAEWAYEVEDSSGDNMMAQDVRNVATGSIFTRKTNLRTQPLNDTSSTNTNWTHYALTAAGGEVRPTPCYVDATQNEQTRGGSNAQGGGTSRIRLGAIDSAWGEVRINDFRVFDRVVSANEASCIMRGANQVVASHNHMMLFEHTGSNLTHPDISDKQNDGVGANGAFGQADNAPTTWHEFGGGN